MNKASQNADESCGLLKLTHLNDSGWNYPKQTTVALNYYPHLSDPPDVVPSSYDST